MSDRQSVAMAVLCILFSGSYCICSDYDLIPEMAVEYSSRPTSESFPASSFNEFEKRGVVRALGQRKRDSALRGLGIRKVEIAGQEWFDLRGLRIASVSFPQDTDFSRLILDHSRFEDVVARGADFHNSLVRGAVFKSCVFEGSSLEGIDAESLYLLLIPNLMAAIFGWRGLWVQLFRVPRWRGAVLTTVGGA